MSKRTVKQINQFWERQELNNTIDILIVPICFYSFYSLVLFVYLSMYSIFYHSSKSRLIVYLSTCLWKLKYAWNMPIRWNSRQLLFLYYDILDFQEWSYLRLVCEINFTSNLLSFLSRGTPPPTYLLNVGRSLLTLHSKGSQSWFFVQRSNPVN